MLKILKNVFISTLILLQLSCDNNPSFENCIEDNCENCNNNPIDDCSKDCNGDWGGNAIIDCAGICNGNSLIDCSGSCISPDENIQYNGDFSSIDCNGICGGDAIIDECGVCEGLGSVYQCGCSGMPQLGSDGNAGNAGFIILESHNFPIEQNQNIRGVSFNNTTITENCGILTELELNGKIEDIQEITFNMPLENFQVPYLFNYYNKSCEEDIIDEQIVCSNSFPNNTIFINKNDQVVYKSSIEISSFSFTIIGATVPRSCDCDLNKYDCSNVCAGNNYNANGCCNDEVPDCLNDCNGNYEELVYDSNQDGNFDAVCNCLETLNEDGCCCNEIRDCADICDGNSVEDDCNICNGDNTTCAGCDGIPNSGLQVDCSGVCDGNEIDIDTDGICDYEDLCIGSAQECDETIDDGCDLPINYILLDNNSNVWYNVNFNISGFQFNVDNTTISSSAGGDAQTNGFTVQAAGNTLIAFSFTGSTIQSGCGSLTQMTLNGEATGLSGIVFSDDSGNAINVEYYNP